MHTNSTQGYYRFSIFFALTSFIGCGLFSMFYFYKESELIRLLTEQAEEIKEMEMQCAAATSALPRQAACNQAADRHLFFHRTQNARQAYRYKASLFLTLSCALPLLTLAIARWWYWVVTGRFLPRKRQEK